MSQSSREYMLVRTSMDASWLNRGVMVSATVTSNTNLNPQASIARLFECQYREEQFKAGTVLSDVTVEIEGTKLTWQKRTDAEIKAIKREGKKGLTAIWAMHQAYFKNIIS